MHQIDCIPSRTAAEAGITILRAIGFRAYWSTYDGHTFTLHYWSN